MSQFENAKYDDVTARGGGGGRQDDDGTTLGCSYVHGLTPETGTVSVVRSL